MRVDNRSPVYYNVLMISFLQKTASFNYTIELSERNLQEKVNAMMPLEKTRFFLTVRLSKPKLELIDVSNEIVLFTHIDVIAPGGIKGSGRGQLSGSLRYEATSGELFLDSPKLKNLQIDWFPKMFSNSVAMIAEPLLATASAKYPVYRLRDDNATHQLAKSTIKSIKVKNHNLVITLGIF